MANVILNAVKANIEIDRLTKDGQSKDARIAELEHQIQTMNEGHETELAELKAGHKTALDEANGKIALLTESVQLLEEQQESAAQKTVKVLSNVGVDAPVEEPKGTKAAADKTTDELWAEYSAISDAKEKRAFYLEHLKPRT